MRSLTQPAIDLFYIDFFFFLRAVKFSFKVINILAGWINVAWKLQLGYMATVGGLFSLVQYLLILNHGLYTKEDIGPQQFNVRQSHQHDISMGDGEQISPFP